MNNCTREHCGGQLALLWTDGGEIEVCLLCRRTPKSQVPTFPENDLKREQELQSNSRANYSR